MAFNRDRQTGKKIGREFMGPGEAMPTQFNRPSGFDGRVGNTANLGSVFGGGMGQANNSAGRAISPMPNIPKGAIFGA